MLAKANTYYEENTCDSEKDDFQRSWQKKKKNTKSMSEEKPKDFLWMLLSGNSQLIRDRSLYSDKPASLLIGETTL